MSGIVCTVLSIIMIAVGGVALYVGTRDNSGNMTTKVGGAFLAVIGVLGLISCLLAE